MDVKINKPCLSGGGGSLHTYYLELSMQLLDDPGMQQTNNPFRLLWHVNIQYLHRSVGCNIKYH